MDIKVIKNKKEIKENADIIKKIKADNKAAKDKAVKDKAAKDKAAKDKAVKDKADKDKAVKATPLYKAYLTAFKAEDRAISRTTEKIELIKNTGLKVSEFFMLLWSEGYKVPELWPLNKAGAPLSPTSSKTKSLLPEINRLVSALDMRNKRKKDKNNPPADPPADPPVDPPVDPNPKIAKYDKDVCVKQLQALMVKTYKEDAVIYEAARTLTRLISSDE